VALDLWYTFDTFVGMTRNASLLYFLTLNALLTDLLVVDPEGWWIYLEFFYLEAHFSIKMDLPRMFYR
jgi:hypothetical protein